MWRLRHNHHVESYLHEISNRRSRVKRTKPSVKLPMSFAKLKALASTDLNLPTLWCTRLLCSNITKSNEEIFVLICIVLPLSCVNHTNTITYLSLYETLWLWFSKTKYQKMNSRYKILENDFVCMTSASMKTIISIKKNFTCYVFTMSHRIYNVKS